MPVKASGEMLMEKPPGVRDLNNLIGTWNTRREPVFRLVGFHM
jgi:hypothetical protein